MPSGEPDYSRVVPCRCVRGGLDGERRNRLKQYSNLGPLTRFTFENLEPQGKSGNPHSQEQIVPIRQPENLLLNPGGG
jgi:hypothetical protein